MGFQKRLNRFGRDPRTGKRKYHSQTVTGNKKAAQKVLNKLLHDQDQGVLVPPDNQQVGEYLMHWLENVKAPSVHKRTADSYRKTITLYLIPTIGHTKISDLKPMTIQKAYKDCESCSSTKPSTATLQEDPFSSRTAEGN